jgi:hypothetical protein
VRRLLAQVEALPKPGLGAAIENQDKLHRGVWSVIGALDYSVKRSAAGVNQGLIQTVYRRAVSASLSSPWSNSFNLRMQVG